MSPIQAALFILPLPLAAFVAGPLAGLLLGRVGSRRLLFLALLVSGAGMGGYLLTYDGAVLPQLVSLSVLGLGIGATMTAASSTIMQSATPERAGMAASIEEVSYELGGALGVTLMGSILSGVYAQSLAVPAGVAQTAAARDSLDEALIVAESLPAELAATLTRLARTAFETGYAAVIATATIMLLATAAFVLLNRARRPTPAG
ncbi:Methyl viologen resistance protein SmvA [compost metagenome]